MSGSGRTLAASMLGLLAYSLRGLMFRLWTERAPAANVALRQLSYDRCARLHL